MNELVHFKEIFITLCWVGIAILFISKLKDVKELVLEVMNRLQQGTIKADMNKKSFEVSLNSEPKNIDLKTEIKELKSATTEKVINRYSNFEYDKSIFALSEFKDSMIILKETTSKIKEELQFIIARNHILSKNTNEYKKYIKNHIERIIKTYDDAFSYSSIDFVNKLSIATITGSFSHIIKNLIDKMFWDIYQNHKNEYYKKESDFKKYELDYSQKKISQSKYVLNKLNRSVVFESEVRVQDNYIVNNGINILEMVLVGLVHDKIKYGMVVNNEK